VVGSIVLHLHAEIPFAPRSSGSWLVDPKLTLGHDAVKRTLQRRLAQHTSLQPFLPSLDDGLAAVGRSRHAVGRCRFPIGDKPLDICTTIGAYPAFLQPCLG
jgi:hypothetical protein